MSPITSCDLQTAHPREFLKNKCRTRTRALALLKATFRMLMARSMMHQRSNFNCNQLLHPGPHHEDSPWKLTYGTYFAASSAQCTNGWNSTYMEYPLPGPHTRYTNPYLLGLHCLLHLPHKADIHTVTILGMRPNLRWPQTEFLPDVQTASMVHTTFTSMRRAVHVQCTQLQCMVWLQKVASCASRWRVFAPARRVHQDL